MSKPAASTLASVVTFLRSIFFTIPIIVIATLVLGAAAIVASLGSRGSRTPERCAALWARMVLAASFVRIRVSGVDKLAPSVPRVICVNHLSYMDPPLLFAGLPGTVRFLAKRSLFRIPVFGWAMRCAGHLPLDRENPRNAIVDLERAAAALQSGDSIVIFAEGSRSPDGTLQPFLSGGFRLAIENHVPVLPVAIAGTREVLRPGSINFRGGEVRVAIGDPLTTVGLTPQDRHRLAARVREVIEKLGEGGGQT